MKKFINCSLSLVTCLFLLSACDYITNPLLHKSGGTVNTSTSVSASDSTGNIKNIMIEDYTGLWCENCPFAAYRLDTIIHQYAPGRIVPLSVNYGYYATPTSPLPAPYNKYNYTSAVGDVYGNLFVTSSGSFPCGFINRVGAITLNSSVYSVWCSLVAAAASDTCFVKLKLSTQFDTISRNLSVTATTTFMKALSGSYNLVILLTEDSMIGPQNIGGVLSLNYPHRFVLHDAINSIWGDSLSNHSTPNQRLSQTFQYTIAMAYPNSNSQIAGYNTPALTCNYKQCSVVAYIYKANASTTQYPAQYVVLQSLALKIYQK